MIVTMISFRIIIVFCLLLLWDDSFTTTTTAFNNILQSNNNNQRQQRRQQRPRRKRKSCIDSTSICFYINGIGRGTVTTTTTTKLWSSNERSNNNNKENYEPDDDDHKNICTTNRYDLNRRTNEQWLMERFKFTKEQIKQRRHYYRFLTQENSKLVARADWLQEELDLTNKELIKIVQGHPMVLAINITTNTEATIDFYIEAADVEEGVVIDFLGRTPRQFSASLKNRLKPRLREAREAGLTIDTGCLRRMATHSDDKWARSLNYQRRKLERGGR